MTIRVRHHIDRLAADMADIPARAAAELPGIVRRSAIEGQEVAVRLATVTAGRHGKHYPKSITVEMIGPLSAEYGPDSSMPQGGMSFEFGSRNQKPHLDLAKSADEVAVNFPNHVGDMIDGLFW